jgi:hypothetical protein
MIQDPYLGGLAIRTDLKSLAGCNRKTWLLQKGKPATQLRAAGLNSIELIAR